MDLNLKTYILPNSTHILAISGGPDSVYLFHHLVEFQKETPFNLILAHVNYHLRGNESDLDEEFVKQIAQSCQVPIEIKNNPLSVDTPNLEAKAREIRYQWLEEMRKKYNATYILTGHHLNDNLETVLLNFTRGASIQGLKGMEIQWKNILRPLLHTNKEEILIWLGNNHIPYRIDRTNFQLVYSRNRIRHKVIPELKKLNPHVEKTFHENLKIIREISDFIEKEAQRWLKKNLKKNYFHIKTFTNLLPVIQKQVLVELYKKYYQHTGELSSEMIERANSLILRGKTSKKTKFGSDVWLEIRYGKSIFSASKKVEDVRVLPMPSVSFKPIKRYPRRKVKNTIFLDAEKLLSQKKESHHIPLSIRMWLPGDRIQPLGLAGMKKLQDIFTDKKIPPKKRHTIPVIFNILNQEIIALPTLGIISEKYKVTDASRKMLEVNIK